MRDSGKNLGVHAAILAALVILDTVGKIGTMPTESVSGVALVPQGHEGETEEEAREVDLITEAVNEMDLTRADQKIEGSLIKTTHCLI